MIALPILEGCAVGERFFRLFVGVVVLFSLKGIIFGLCVVGLCRSLSSSTSVSDSESSFTLPAADGNGV